MRLALYLYRLLPTNYSNEPKFLMFSETRLALLLSGWLLIGNTLASSLEYGVVYSETDTFNNEISLTEDFRIGESGRYEATLKDLENTRPFTQSSL